MRRNVCEVGVGGISIDCMMGSSAYRKVLLGFASARLLHGISFADTLDQDTGRGYQRRLNVQHSLDFRRYIQCAGSATIPLTFNLRPGLLDAWRVVGGSGGRARLEVRRPSEKVLAQVDCQHRLGHLADQDVELPFMTFVGLSDREETEIFQVINSKAKGLSPSLLDFHDARLASDLAAERPELFVALYLKNEPASPWFNQLDLGGTSTSGLARRASLRTMQKAVKVFLTRTLGGMSAEVAAQTVLEFWSAVACVMSEAWARPRKHMLTKGIGVYALMELAADLVADAPPGCTLDRRYFSAKLADFAADFDWSAEGPLRGLGGEGGVKTAVGMLRAVRRRRSLKVVPNGW